MALITYLTEERDSKLPGQIKWADDQEAVTFLGYRPIRS